MLIFLKGFSLVMAMKRKAKFQLTLYLSNFIIRSLEERYCAWISRLYSRRSICAVSGQGLAGHVLSKAEEKE